MIKANESYKHNLSYYDYQMVYKNIYCLFSDKKNYIIKIDLYDLHEGVLFNEGLF
jgi:hypothetical protein